MGFFTCNNCGECLKKNAVQKHSSRCRTLQGVSCMDCHRLFGDDFVNHLSCVTEQEKYGGSDFVAKESKNKKKQEQWVDHVIDAWKNDDLIKCHFNHYFKDPTKWQNIPRNLTKLKNYLTNSLRMRMDLAEQFCRVASRVQESINQEKTQVTNNSQTDHNDIKRKNEDADICLPSKKLRLERTESRLDAVSETMNNGQVGLVKERTKEHKKVFNGSSSKEDGNNLNKENLSSVNSATTLENGNATKFKWKSSIKNILKANDSKMKLKKLQKIIVKQYLSHIGDENCIDEAKELFQNKIKNNKFILEDKYIQLK